MDINYNIILQNRKRLYNLNIFKSLHDSVFIYNIKNYKSIINQDSLVKIALLILVSDNTHINNFINNFCNHIDQLNYSFKIFFSCRSSDSIKNNNEYIKNIAKKHKINVEFLKWDNSVIGTVNNLYFKSYRQGYNYFYFSFDYVSFRYENYFLDCINNLKKKNDLGVSGAYNQFNHSFLENIMVSWKHMDIFGFLFPPELEDNQIYQWISGIYKEEFYNPLEVIELEFNNKLSEYDILINTNDNKSVSIYRELINILSIPINYNNILHDGELVIIKDLNNNKQYNGLLGCIHEFNKYKEKYKIKLVNDNKFLLLKQENLYNFLDELINIINFYMHTDQFHAALKLLVTISNSKIIEEKKAYILFLIGKCNENIGYDFERCVLPQYIKTYNFKKSRLEPLYQIMMYYKKTNNYNKIFSYGMLGYPIKEIDNYNTKPKLYLYLFYYELAEAAFKMKIYDLCYDIYSILILNNNYPDNLRESIITNLKQCVKQLNINLPNEKYCIL